MYVEGALRREYGLEVKVHYRLQIRELSLYQSKPSAVPPPSFHSFNLFPHRFFINIKDFIFYRSAWVSFSFCDFNCCLVIAADRDKFRTLPSEWWYKEVLSTHLSRSKSSFLSGKNSRGSSTANTASAVRKRNESPSSSIISHSLAQASKDKWSRKRGTIHSGRYAEGEIWCCLKLK